MKIAVIIMMGISLAMLAYTAYTKDIARMVLSGVWFLFNWIFYLKDKENEGRDKLWNLIIVFMRQLKKQ